MFFYHLNNIRYFLGDDAAGEVGFAARTEGDGAIREREERVVVTDPYIFPGLDLGPALADDDHACAGDGTVSKLYTKVFWVGIVEVFR
mgnify:CR=1 FL=1